MFDMTTNTPVTIDGKIYMVRFYPGMSGIGSRKFWINDKDFYPDAVRHTDDLETGNHFLYLMKWRDTPWDKVHVFIKEELLQDLINDQNAWREPRKINL